jgi:hypothetical protein
MDDVIGLEHCVAFSYDILYAVDLELKSAARHIGDLCVGVMMEGSDGAFLEGVFYYHQIIRISQNAAGNSASHILRLDVFVIYPSVVFHK